MLIYSIYHHWSYKNMIPRISYKTYESLTPSEQVLITHIDMALFG